MSETAKAVALLRRLANGAGLDELLARHPSRTSVSEARDLLLYAAHILESLQPAISGTAPESSAEPKERTKTAGALRVFTDGAARGNPGPAGAGAVLFDDQGQVVERVCRYLGRATNNVAEYEAVILGLNRALAHGARRIELCSDSELLVHQLSGRYKVRAEHLRPLYEETRGLLARLDGYELRHVPRARNSEADALANKAIDEAPTAT